MNFQTFKFSNSRAFTLVELLVVISIATVLLTAVIIQHSKWNDRLSVSTQAYELVLMLRQAQIYGLGVKENPISGSTGDKFDLGYGVHMSTVDSTASGRYIFFADRNKNQKYDSGEAVETKNFIRGVTITRICGATGGCSDAATNKQVSISFFRPDPKAVITFLNSAGGVIGGFTPPVTIYLRSSSGVQFIVTVESNGQISLQ